MKVKQSDFAAAMSLLWRQAPAPLVFSFLATLLLVRPVYGLQVYDRVPSGVLDTLVWLTVAALASHHRFSPHLSSNQCGLSISAR
jgi:ABC-type protease/lipase transport system fused ATPase/permease subunit